MKKKVIDISTEEKKKEVFERLDGFTSKNQAHEYFGISDNKQGSEYLKEIALAVGFDLSIYKERRKKPIKYCKQCGKEITSKWGKDFCCSSCATKYNNEHRDKSVYEKVANALKKNKVANDRYCIVCGKRLDRHKIKYCSTECRYEHYKQENKGNCHTKTVFTKKCECCGKEFRTKNLMAKFCSNECSTLAAKEKKYKDFIENNDKYCRGNYTPKRFLREVFLTEQNGVCAICKCKPEHNGKPLVFVLDHIDGDASNNRRENLRMICPNCDSQLDTFKSKNKNSTRRNYWKEHILKNIPTMKETFGITRDYMGH